MSRAALLILMAGAGWWAYQNGHLDPYLDRFGLTGPETAEPRRASGVLDDLGGPSPVLATVGTGIHRAGLSREEQFLWDNTDILSDWVQGNATWAAAMMWQESRGRTSAKSHKGALGLMQVMPGTAKHMYQIGYRQFEPTQEVLLTARGSIYFGSAYLEYLSGKSSDREWITRAYNAGPGGKRKDGTWPSETVKYLAAVKRRYSELVEGVMT